MLGIGLNLWASALGKGVVFYVESQAAYDAVSQRTWPGGAHIYVKRGLVFDGDFDVPNSFSPGKMPITVESYGNPADPLPVLNGYRYAKTSSWVLHSGNVWKLAINDPTKCTGATKAITRSHPLDAPGDHANEGANVGFLRVDGVFHADKKQQLSSLVSDWQFYSDYVDTLYVYSATNPGSRATEIAVAPHWCSLLVPRSGVSYFDLEVRGTGGYGWHGFYRTDVTIKRCKFKEIGGSFTPGNLTRYGNGVEGWNGTKRLTVVGNWFETIYDCAYSLQGEIKPDDTERTWEDCIFDYNVIIKCAQGYEFWGKKTDGTYPGNGMKRCKVRNNIVIDAGYGLDYASRPDQTDRSPILIDFMQIDELDIEITGNLYYNWFGDMITSYYKQPYELVALGLKLHDEAFYCKANTKVGAGAYYFGNQITMEHLMVFANTPHNDSEDGFDGFGLDCALNTIPDQATDVSAILAVLQPIVAVPHTPPAQPDPAATNLWTFANDFSQGVWTKARVEPANAAQSNQALMEQAINNTHLITRTVSKPAAQATYIYQFDIKGGLGRTTARLQMTDTTTTPNALADMDVVNRVLGLYFEDVGELFRLQGRPYFIALPGGGYRVGMWFRSSAQPSLLLRLNIKDDVGATSYLGDTTKGLYVRNAWLYQS